MPGSETPSTVRDLLIAAGADGRPLWGFTRDAVFGNSLLLADGDDALWSRQDYDGKGCARTLLQRYSAGGELLWTRSPTRLCDGTFSGIAFESMALLPNRDIVLAGTFKGRIDFGTGPLTSEGYNIVLMTMGP